MTWFRHIPIEKVKEFWDRRPCNIRHSPKPVGTREYFDEVEARKYFVEPHIPRLAEFPRWKGKKVLEIGCGIGTDTINFARHGAWVTAVELSERSLEIARKRAEVYGLSDRIRFYLGDAEELSRFVPVEPYDLIYSFGSSITRLTLKGSLRKCVTTPALERRSRSWFTTDTLGRCSGFF
jgi:2-polyprenyl-3-methyl-5-hydroxy-6-metoxy-1,4-benzoquinol methylase